MTSNQSPRPATFGFRDGQFYTTKLMHVALLRALGFRVERLERASSGDYWFCAFPDGGAAAMTLPQAVSGIHDPRCLGGSDRERVEFYKVAQEHYQTALLEVKRGD
jgi:hypothetical protein